MPSNAIFWIACSFLASSLNANNRVTAMVSTTGDRSAIMRAGNRTMAYCVVITYPAQIVIRKPTYEESVLNDAHETR